MDTSTHRSALDLAVGIGLVALFMVLRAGLYDELGRENWYFLDFAMNLPRAFCLILAALWLRRRLGRVGLALAETRTFLPRGALVLACSLPMIFRGTSSAWPGGSSFVIVCFSTVFVALFEEVSMRGVVFGAARSLFPLRSAILLSAGIFTIFHVQAQPLWSFPSHFALGVSLAAIRARGVGLGWLVLLHFAIDVVYFLGKGGPDLFPGATLVATLVEAGAAVALWRELPRRELAPAGVERAA